MGATGPSLPVSPIPVGEPQVGLIDSAVKPPAEEMAGGDWKMGIKYRPEGCATGQVFFADCTPVNDDKIVSGALPDTVEWIPYILSASFRCSTFGGEWDELRAEIVRLMRGMTETLLGYEFWTGTKVSTTTRDIGDGNGAVPLPNTWLADDAEVDVIGSGALEPFAALACLETYLLRRNGGQQGMIHASAGVVSQWDNSGALTRENGRIYTINRNIVVPSPGYPGTSPSGTLADGNVWAYATDLVRVWIDDRIDVSDLQGSVSYSGNIVEPVAQRVALAEWQRCRHGGVQIDVEACEGSGS